MKRLPLSYQLVYEFIPPRHSRFWFWAGGNYNRYRMSREQRIAEIDAAGMDRLGALLERGDSVLITPNHADHADDYVLYEHIVERWRQVCWSHLMRDFQAMIDRGGAGQGIGERLLALSKRLFRQWHRVRDGTLTWVAFQERMRRLRREVKQALEAESACGCAKTAATCFEILEVEEGLWTFARVQGVEPTNNVAERAMRHAVIWRKISGGTDSARGSPSWSGCSRLWQPVDSMAATCSTIWQLVLNRIADNSRSLPSCLRNRRKSKLLDTTYPAL